MDDGQAEVLGLRLLAYPGFRWLPGMVDDKGQRVLAPLHDGTERLSAGFASTGDDEPPGSPDHACVLAPKPHHMGWPDLRDPATMGAALHLLRERVPEARALKVNFAGAWVYVRTGRAGVVNDLSEPQPTEAEALVAALEAANV